MKRAYVAVFFLIVCAVLMSGCYSQAQYMKNATYGANFYDYNKLHYWKDSVVMSASGVNATWNMTIYVRNDTLNGTLARYMQVVTEGNGMNITYNIWSNATTYAVLLMHATGYMGDYYQDRDTSTLQIFTLPDVGLSFYYVPFSLLGNITARTANGNVIPVSIYSATSSTGFSVIYSIYPPVPVPLKVEMVDKNYTITESLLEYG